MGLHNIEKGKSDAWKCRNKPILSPIVFAFDWSMFGLIPSVRSWIMLRPTRCEPAVPGSSFHTCYHHIHNLGKELFIRLKACPCRSQRLESDGSY